MKQVIAIFAIAALTACSGASTEVKTDSAAQTVDTTKATVTTDTTAKQDTSFYKKENAGRKAEQGIK